jgi:uncharacterized protein
MQRRSFIKKLSSWIFAVLFFFGFGGLACRFDDSFADDDGEDQSVDPGRDIGSPVEVGKSKEPEEEASGSEGAGTMVNNRRMLGKTGFAVSLFSLGGESTLEQSARADEAEEIINRALDLGVNYIDTAPAYGGGGSESNIGRVLEYRRGDVFLATKTADRSYEGTMRQIENSLKRLRTDHLDLYQLHNIRTDNDLNSALAEDGAIRALEELKSQGVIHFTGITGHKDPEVLLRGIKTYSFDCLLMSFNAGDVHYASFKDKLLPEAVRLEMGIIAMKVTAVSRIFRDEGISSMKQALDYVFSHPISTAIVGISHVSEVEENITIAAEHKTLLGEELARLESLTAAYADEVNFFKHHW